MSLLIFDFDWSLVNENSDTYVFKVLSPRILEEIYYNKEERSNLGWTALMDKKIMQLQQKTDYNIDDISDTVANIPVLSGMLDALRIAKQNDGHVAIVSDANEIYINSFVSKNGLKELIDEIHTNLSPVETISGKEIMRILPYHPRDSPHECPLCPPNMCKGRILDDLVKKYGKDKYLEICYVGDGSGDFCAATRLKETDTLLVRNDRNYKSALGLVKSIERKKDSHPVKANIVHWTTGEEVVETVRKIFDKSKTADL